MLTNQVKGSIIHKVPDKHIVLFSGGIDSIATAITLLQKNIKPELLFIQTGAIDNSVSLRVSKTIAKSLQLNLVVDDSIIKYGSRFSFGEELYIPRRNIVFCIIAANYGKHIYLGGIKGDYTNDKSPKVFQITFKMLNASGNKDEQVYFCDSILWDKNKIDVAKIVKNAGYANLVHQAISCYSGTEKHCGYCQACFRKYVMLKEINMETNIFMTNPMLSRGKIYYQEQIEQNKYHENIPEKIMAKYACG